MCPVAVPPPPPGAEHLVGGGRKPLLVLVLVLVLVLLAPPAEPAERRLFTGSNLLWQPTTLSASLRRHVRRSLRMLAVPDAYRRRNVPPLGPLVTGRQHGT